MEEIEAVGDRAEPDERREAERRQPAQRHCEQGRGRDRGDLDVGQAVAGGDRRQRRRDHRCRPAAVGARAEAVSGDADREEGNMLLEQQRAEQPGGLDPDEVRREAPDPVEAHPEEQQRLDPAEQAQPPEQGHRDVESELDRQRPVDAVDGRQAGEALQHRRIGGEGGRRQSELVHAGDEHGGAGEQHRCPVSRVEPREARHREVGERPRALERHEDDEAADPEEELDPEMTPGDGEGQGAFVAVKLAVAGGVVEQHHGQRGEAAQRVEVGDPARRRRWPLQGHPAALTGRG